MKYDIDLLERVKNIQLDIMLEINRICEKHSIQYYLVEGTLLGCIRHKDFIPWDDDIDIAMPRADFLRFVQVCKKELGSEYYLQTQETEKTYWLPFAKVRKNRTLFIEKNLVDIDTHHGIWVDVFVLDKVARKDGMVIRFQGAVSEYAKTIIPKRRGVANQKMGIRTHILYYLTRMLSIAKLSGFRDFCLSCQERSKKSIYYANFGSAYGYKKQIFRIDDYDPPIKGKFRGHEFWIPKESDRILTTVYGKDYMQLPPVSQRKTHSPQKMEIFDHH